MNKTSMLKTVAVSLSLTLYNAHHYKGLLLTITLQNFSGVSGRTVVDDIGTYLLSRPQW
jgi:hypothetical protein